MGTGSRRWEFKLCEVDVVELEQLDGVGNGRCEVRLDEVVLEVVEHELFDEVTEVDVEVTFDLSLCNSARPRARAWSRRSRYLWRHSSGVSRYRCRMSEVSL